MISVFGLTLLLCHSILQATAVSPHSTTRSTQETTVINPQSTPLSGQTQVEENVLNPEDLANKAKMLVNSGKNDEAKALVQKTIAANKFPKANYLNKLQRLLPQDIIEDWVPKT